MRIVCGVSNHNNKTNNNYLQKKKCMSFFFNQLLDISSIRIPRNLTWGHGQRLKNTAVKHHSTLRD